MVGELQAGIDEVERVVAGTDLDDDALVEAEALRLLGIIALDDPSLARLLAQDILASGDRVPGDGALAVAMTALAFAAWDCGDVADAMVLLRGAVQRSDRTTSDTAAVLPRLRLAAALTSLGSLDEAAQVIDEAETQIDAMGAGLWCAGPAAQRAALHLAAGRLDDARVEANAALATCAERGTELFVSAAHSVLGTVALHRGDILAAARHLGRQHAASGAKPSAIGPGSGALAAAILAQATGDDARLAAAVDALFERVSRQRRVLVDEPAAAAWLTSDLVTDDRRRAEVVVVCVEQLAAANPGVRALAAAASHARGVLDGDVHLLQRAADDHPHMWARASAREDAGVVLLQRGDHSRARALLVAALDSYRDAGADLDTRRIQRQLNRLERRQRRERPVSGWDSLTDTERRVAAVVAEGLTNAEVGERLYLSRHTVDFHLRHVFDKLAVRSRVALVPLVLQHAGGLTPSA
jgi:DNA-binding CsgD family transcriptional regulator